MLKVQKNCEAVNWWPLPHLVFQKIDQHWLKLFPLQAQTVKWLTYPKLIEYLYKYFKVNLDEACRFKNVRASKVSRLCHISKDADWSCLEHRFDYHQKCVWQLPHYDLLMITVKNAWYLLDYESFPSLKELLYEWLLADEQIISQ